VKGIIGSTKLIVKELLLAALSSFISIKVRRFQNLWLGSSSGLSDHPLVAWSARINDGPNKRRICCLRLQFENRNALDFKDIQLSKTLASKVPKGRRQIVCTGKQ
jgi:hypothetical protein